MEKAILFVDDEENVLSSLRRELEEWLDELGYGIETANSVNEGLSKINFNPAKYHVVVSDLKMPEKLGTALLGEIVALYPDISTILLTGFAEIEEIKRAIAQGIVAFIQKPWDANLLRAELIRAIELNRLKRERREQSTKLELEAHWLKRIHHAILLPKQRNDSDLQWSLAYHPADGTPDGGGDFFQILEQSAHKLMVCIGSVDAKGAQGTFHALLVRDELRNLVFSHSKTEMIRPNTLMEQLNSRILALQVKIPGCFMTLTIASIDLTAGRLQVCSAGGEHYMLCHNHEWSTHHLPGPGIGYRDNILFTTQEHPISPGDRFIFTSQQLLAHPTANHNLSDQLTRIKTTPVVAGLAKELLDNAGHIQDSNSDQTVIICGWH